MVVPATRLDASGALRMLHRVFGYDSFRGEQQEIIDHVIAGGDALVLMPTGGGKSLCYQIPALVRTASAWSISPLIALMQDQVDALTRARRAGRVPQLHPGLRRAAAWSRRRSWRASSTCSTSRPSGCGVEATLSGCSTGARSRCSRSTRRTACPSGATTSGPTTSALSDAARALARRAAHRADRDGHPGHPRRDRHPAAA